jgi:hypothetical protein
MLKLGNLKPRTLRVSIAVEEEAIIPSLPKNYEDGRQ